MAKSYLDKDGLLYFLQKIRPSATPSMDGTASTGTSKRFAAEDHVHPSDTTKAPLASPALTGTPTAPTAATGTTTTQIATTEFVANAVAASTSGVSDVRVNGTSVTTSGVANIPPASEATYGAIKFAKVMQPTTAEDSYNYGYITYYLGSTEKEQELATTEVATTLKRGLMSKADKTKLNKLVFDGNNLIDSSILPSYVDDVIEAYPRSGQTELSQNWLSLTSGGSALTPETGKIYILMADSTSYATNTQFRWSGTAYVKMLDGGVTAITNGEIDTIVAS